MPGQPFCRLFSNMFNYLSHTAVTNRDAGIDILAVCIFRQMKFRSLMRAGSSGYGGNTVWQSNPSLIETQLIISFGAENKKIKRIPLVL